MNRKLYALLAVLVFASMVLSACGRCSSSTAPQEPPRRPQQPNPRHLPQLPR